MVSVGGDRDGYLWDVPTATCVLKLRGHSARINSVCLLPSITHFAPPERFNSSNSSKPTSNNKSAAAAGATASAAVGLSAGGNAGALGDFVVATASTDYSVHLWDPRARARPVLQVLTGFTDGVSCVRPALTAAGESADGSGALGGGGAGYGLLCASLDGTVRSFDLRHGGVAADSLGAPVTWLAVTADGAGYLAQTLPTALRSSTASMTASADTGTATATAKTVSSKAGLTSSADGSRCSSGSKTSARERKRALVRELRELEQDKSLGRLGPAFSCDGSDSGGSDSGGSDDDGNSGTDNDNDEDSDSGYDTGGSGDDDGNDDGAGSTHKGKSDASRTSGGRAPLLSQSQARRLLAARARARVRAAADSGSGVFSVLRLVDRADGTLLQAYQGPVSKNYKIEWYATLKPPQFALESIRYTKLSISHAMLSFNIFLIDCLCCCISAFVSGDSAIVSGSEDGLLHVFPTDPHTYTDDYTVAAGDSASGRRSGRGRGRGRDMDWLCAPGVPVRGRVIDCARTLAPHAYAHDSHSHTRARGLGSAFAGPPCHTGAVGSVAARPPDAVTGRDRGQLLTAGVDGALCLWQ